MITHNSLFIMVSVRKSLYHFDLHLPNAVLVPIPPLFQCWQAGHPEKHTQLQHQLGIERVRPKLHNNPTPFDTQDQEDKHLEKATDRDTKNNMQQNKIY